MTHKTSRPLLQTAALSTLAIASALIAPCLLVAQTTSAVIFQNGKDGYPIYRIPAIVKAANGDLLAFSEARQGGDTSQIDLVLKRSNDGGLTWGKLEMVQNHNQFQYLFPKKAPPISVGNPAPVVDTLDPKHPGRIWLPFTVENNFVFVTYSDDHGKTWSKHRQITKQVKKADWGWYATGPVHSIQVSKGKNKGRLVIPCDHRIGKGGHDHGANGVHVVMSDDHGQTWNLGAIDDTYSDGLNGNETSVVELSNGSLFFNTRDQHGKAPGTRGDAYSTDGGTSFSETGNAKYRTFAPSQKILDPPVVQCSLLNIVAHRPKKSPVEMILFCGPDSNGPSGKGRSDLRLRISFDQTKSWADGPLIHTGPAAYSDMVSIDKNFLGMIYEAGKKGSKRHDQIRFSRVKKRDLLKSNK